jgi:hypothetical protein
MYHFSVRLEPFEAGCELVRAVLGLDEHLGCVRVIDPRRLGNELLPALARTILLGLRCLELLPLSG